MIVGCLKITEDKVSKRKSQAKREGRVSNQNAQTRVSNQNTHLEFY